MNDKRYTITITENTFEKRVLGKDWKQGAGNTPEEYGYTPEVEKLQAVERKLFEQNTDTLDLINVIKAVNGL